MLNNGLVQEIAMKNVQPFSIYASSWRIRTGEKSRIKR